MQHAAVAERDQAIQGTARSAERNDGEVNENELAQDEEQTTERVSPGIVAMRFENGNPEHQRQAGGDEDPGLAAELGQSIGGPGEIVFAQAVAAADFANHG